MAVPRSTLLALALLAPAGAFAEPGEDVTDPAVEITFGGATDPGVDEAQPEERAPVVSFAVGQRWSASTPATLRDVADVAVHPDDSTLVAFVTSSGAAWLSTDGGARWREVLLAEGRFGATSSDEDLFRDVEAFIEDVVDDSFVDDPTEYEDFEDADAEAEAIASSAEDAAQDALQAADAVRGDLDTGAALIQDVAGVSGGAHVWWGPAGELLVGRSDGLHLSTDNGGGFVQVLDVRVHALTYLAQRGLWVAGTSDGVRWAVDPRGWIDAEDATTGVEVRDLSVVEEGVYAATDSGVFFAADAQSWERLGAEAPYVAIAADPDWSGGFWVASETRILRSDNRGETFRASLGAPLTNTVDIEWITGGQLLISTRSDGPWESLDGGTRFHPISEGLTDPDTRALSVRGRTVYLAAAEGLFRLVEAEIVTREVKPFVPLGALLSAATNRPGLTPRGPTATVLQRAFLPSVRLEGYAHPEKGLFWDGGTTRDVGSEWKVTARLVFSPSGRRVDTLTTTETTAVVFDGGVELITDEGMGGAMDRRGRRAALTYRALLIERIASVHGARIELAGRSRGGLTLYESVELELTLRELDAELDLLTEGEVSRWTHTSKEEG